MTNIEYIWEDAPEMNLDVEKTWDEFIKSISGTVISENLSKSPNFNNADYLIPSEEVVIELKEITTEFSKQPRFMKEYEKLIKKLIQEDPNWRPALFGGANRVPAWFNQGILRIFRPPISRILKKANRQIKETKEFYEIKNNKGVIVIVNDGFNTVEPALILDIATDLLLNSYSSIDCIVYATLNRFLIMDETGVPKILWTQVYSDRVESSYPEFIDELGRSWFKFLETKINFTVPKEETNDYAALIGMTPIVLSEE